MSASNVSLSTEDHPDRHGLLYVGLAVLFFSTSPVFIRWADTLSSYEIAAWRLLIAAVALRLAMVVKGESWSIPRQEWRRFLLYGLITGLHFLFYIASLTYTTIAHSLAIVYTAPIFVTLFSAIFLHEPIPRRKWGGIVLAVGSGRSGDFSGVSAPFYTAYVAGRYAGFGISHYVWLVQCGWAFAAASVQSLYLCCHDLRSGSPVGSDSSSTYVYASGLQPAHGAQFACIRITATGIRAYTL
ncbi:MAG: DMT family transporter [Chloroflexi bacterium]|nr:DMT family transporter [Chloroflexota bacterium]